MPILELTTDETVRIRDELTDAAEATLGRVKAEDEDAVAFGPSLLLELPDGTLYRIVVQELETAEIRLLRSGERPAKRWPVDDEAMPGWFTAWAKTTPTSVSWLRAATPVAQRNALLLPPHAVARVTKADHPFHGRLGVIVGYGVLDGDPVIDVSPGARPHEFYGFAAEDLEVVAYHRLLGPDEVATAIGVRPGVN